MKFAEKYVFPIFHYVAVFLFGIIPFEVFSLALRTLHGYLTRQMPEVFPDYSPVLDPEKYAEVLQTTDMLALALTILVLTYIAMRMDNARFEYTVTPTGGLYRIPESYLRHLREFTLSDLIVSLAVPCAFVLLAYLLPPVVMSYGADIVLWAGVKSAKYFDMPTALCYTAFISLAARLVLTPKMLIDWRACWLASSVE